MLTFFMGGNIRERAKSPQTVYGMLEKPEATSYEQNRFLTYEKCLQCHGSPKDLRIADGETWSDRITIERRRAEVDITDDEAGRIISYFEEQE